MLFQIKSKPRPSAAVAFNIGPASGSTPSLYWWMDPTSRVILERQAVVKLDGGGSPAKTATKRRDGPNAAERSWALHADGGPTASYLAGATVWRP